MRELYQWIVDFDWINLATIVSGFATLAIALLTLFLLRENKLLRKAGSDPNLVAYFEMHPDGTGGLNITIINIGSGPAKNVYFQFIDDQEEFKNYEILFDCSIRRGPYIIIPQGEKLSMLFAVGYELFKPKNSDERRAMKPFRVKVEWESIDCRKKRQAEFLLDVSVYKDLPGLINKPYLLQISHSINGMKKGVDRLIPEVKHLTQTIESSTLKDEIRTKEIVCKDLE